MNWPQGSSVRDLDSTLDHPVFNRTIGGRDPFPKEAGGKGWPGLVASQQ
jgi:glutaminyl-tRNA synthetase